MTRQKLVNAIPDFSSDDPGKAIPVYLSGHLFTATYRGEPFSDASYHGLVEQVTSEMAVLAELAWLPMIKLIIRPLGPSYRDSLQLFPSVACERCYVSDRTVRGSLYICDWVRPFGYDERTPWPRFLGSRVMDVPHAAIPLQLPCTDYYSGPMGDWRGLYLAYTDERWRALSRWSARLSSWVMGGLQDMLLSPDADSYLEQQAHALPGGSVR